MFAYLSIKADMARDNDGGLAERGRSAESVLQDAEAQAWAKHLEGVNADG
jgi:hypothetical protein